MGPITNHAREIMRCELRGPYHAEQMTAAQMRGA
jgi:hypothetical protein